MTSPDLKHYRAPLSDHLAARVSYLVALLFGCTLAMVVAALVMRAFS